MSYITESRTSSAVQDCDESDVLVPDLLTWRVRSWSVGTPAIRTSDHGQYPVRDMPKAARVLAALQRDGWTETRRRGSHRVLVKDDRRRVWAYHEGVDLGGPAMARVAKDYGYTLAELRKLSDDDQMSTRLRAEFLFDDEANNWHYRVPALHINGGGAATRKDAERQCMDAISFALEGDPSEYDRDTQAIALEVSVAPAA